MFSIEHIFLKENNIENIQAEVKVYTNQPSIFIIDCMKMPQTVAMRRCLQVYS